MLHTSTGHRLGGLPSFQEQIRSVLRLASGVDLGPAGVKVHNRGHIKGSKPFYYKHNGTTLGVQLSNP